jgi:hypothetical protein
MCITTALTGGSIASWSSPYGIAPLVNNAVYRIRMTMNTTQTGLGKVPLWDLIIQNTNGGTGGTFVGDDAYAADYWFLDNTGSANAIKGPAPGRTDFQAWFTPGAVLTPQWQSTTNGAFSSTNAPNKDFRLVLRCIDIDGIGYVAEQDEGTICVSNISIDRFDIANVVAGTSVYNNTNLVSSAGGDKTGLSKQDIVDNTSDGGGTTATYSGGVLTAVPARSEGWKVHLCFFRPGDTNNPNLGAAGSAEIVDNYPIKWETDTLYQILVGVSANDATGVSNGADAIRLGFDAKTNELLGDQYILTGLAGRPGVPQVAAPQSYTMFLWSHNKTASTAAEADRLRWKIDILNTDAYNRPQASGYNKGGVKIHSIQVRKVTFPGM